MIDYPNTVKSLEAQVKRFQKEHAIIYQLLLAEGIKCMVFRGCVFSVFP